MNNRISRKKVARSRSNPRPSFVTTEDSDDDSLPDPEEDVRAEPKRSKKAVAYLAAKHRLAMSEEDAKAEAVPSDEQILANLPFCCAVCTCSDERKARADPSDPFVSPAENQLYHRKCCHGCFEVQDGWAAPFQAAVEQAMDGEGTLSSGNPRACLKQISEADIEQKYQAEIAYATRHINDAETVNTFHLPFSTKEYVERILTPFNDMARKITQGEEPRRNAVVLDLFGGIGTSLVCLKRNKIAIDKVIVVEHDKVAVHVYKSNHDSSYNEKLPDDGIKYIYINKFEEIYDEHNPNVLQAFLEKYKPIDLVIGGPPCQDFSHANALRQGVRGIHGRKMLHFADVARTIVKSQQPLPVYYLAENVLLQNEDLAAVRGAFFDGCWDPYMVDAKFLSPTKRDRHFFTNLPVDLTRDIYNEDSLRAVREDKDWFPNSCLDDGYILPVHVVNKQELAWAGCFMGSIGRIDDNRMYVVKKGEAKKYMRRPMNVAERERMMGFTKGYVEQPVKALFETLLEQALSHNAVHDESWKDCLHTRFHHFAGNYHAFPDSEGFIFKGINDDLFQELLVEISMAPPISTPRQEPSYYDRVMYSKHLIGNAFSVPVVEYLLGRLKEIFDQRDYGEAFNYSYCWE